MTISRFSWFSRPANSSQVTHAQRLWLYGLCGVIMIFLVVPTFIVIPMSFSASRYLEFPPKAFSLRWYETFFASSEWMLATRTSLITGFLTALLTTPMGTLAAYGMHVSQGKFVRVAFVVLLTPMMVPVILVAVGLFYVYAQLGLLYSVTGLVIAHSMIALPLVVIVVGSALKTFDFAQERAARSLGAPRWHAFMTVTLPQIKFSVLTAALLAFLTSFDEVVVAMFVSGGDNPTLTRNMFNALRDEIDPTIAAISTLMIAITTTALVITQVIGGRSKGASGQ